MRVKSALTDKCTDELLASEISDNLIFVARELSKNRFPNELKHPLTQKPLEGVEVIQKANAGVAGKK